MMTHLTQLQECWMVFCNSVCTRPNKNDLGDRESLRRAVIQTWKTQNDARFSNNASNGAIPFRRLIVVEIHCDINDECLALINCEDAILDVLVAEATPSQSELTPAGSTEVDVTVASQWYEVSAMRHDLGLYGRLRDGQEEDFLQRVKDDRLSDMTRSCRTKWFDEQHHGPE